MESLTKNRQSCEVLRAMVTRAYGADQVAAGDSWAEELGHGWFNVAYAIRLRDGTRVVLKIAPPAGVEVMTYERDLMRVEVRALSLIREQTAVPVPALHYFDGGRDLCDADYFFMEFIEGENLGLVPAERAAAYHEALGATNRELNQIRGDHFGSLLGGQPGATWRAVFTRMVAEVLLDGERRDVDLGWDYAVVRETLARHSESLDEVTVPAFVEWDMWPSNVLVHDGAIAGVIDHERAFFGDPLMEAGFVATELPAKGDPAGFLRGYGHGPLTAGERVRRRLYNLHLLLIMVVEITYRELTEPGHAERTKAALNDVMASLGHRR